MAGANNVTTGEATLPKKLTWATAHQRRRSAANAAYEVMTPKGSLSTNEANSDINSDRVVYPIPVRLLPQANRASET